MYIAKLEDELRGVMNDRLLQSKHRLSLLCTRLEGLSPLSRLSGGYSYVSNASGTVNSIKKTKKGDELSIYMSDGIVSSRVESIISKDITGGTDGQR